MLARIKISLSSISHKEIFNLRGKKANPAGFKLVTIMRVGTGMIRIAIVEDSEDVANERREFLEM
ncbi:MAG: hypothetical protein OXU66_06110, partial [Gammaproteobacteria bacterium]|nr:hypothetical protein [Gammaproteobacteria bacterium]